MKYSEEGTKGLNWTYGLNKWPGPNLRNSYERGLHHEEHRKGV
jgi:hypothetical protein